MSILIKHHHQTAKSNNPNRDVSATAWNEEHDVLGLGGLAQIDDAPSDGNPYLRKNAAWVQGLIDVASDGKTYGRKDGAWSEALVDALSDGKLYGRKDGAWVKTVYADTAANLATANPTLLAGEIGFETDTISFKIGDGATAYNTLTYAYRGLPVAGEPSLGTPHSHNTILLNNYDPGSSPTTLTITLTVAGGIANPPPLGTKRISYWGSFKSANVNDYIYVNDRIGAVGSNHHVLQYSQAANQPIGFSGEVLIDSAMSFDFYSSSSAISGVYLVMTEYNM